MQTLGLLDISNRSSDPLCMGSAACPDPLDISNRSGECVNTPRIHGLLDISNRSSGRACNGMSRLLDISQRPRELLDISNSSAGLLDISQ